MIPCAVFPLLPTTIPIVRHIMNSSSEYAITTLLSFPGTGVEGQDGSIVDCREPLGMNIQIDIKKEPYKWDCLLVFEHQETLQPRQNDQYTERIIISALKMHKKVVCAKRLSLDAREHFKKVEADNHCQFIYLPFDWTSPSVKKVGALRRLHSFYVLFGSVINDTTSLDACFSCVEMLSKTHRVSVVSTEENTLMCGTKSLAPIIHAQIPEIEKVYAINQYLADAEYERHPEITVVFLSEPMLAFDDTEPNGFGIIPFMLSKSMQTQMFICSVPFSYQSQSFYKYLSDGVLHQYGYPIDGICLSNILLDSTSSAERKHISAVYMNNKFVDGSFHSTGATNGIPTYNTLNSNEKKRLVSEIESAFSDYISSRVIP